MIQEQHTQVSSHVQEALGPSSEGEEVDHAHDLCCFCIEICKLCKIIAKSIISNIVYSSPKEKLTQTITT